MKLLTSSFLFILSIIGISIPLNSCARNSVKTDTTNKQAVFQTKQEAESAAPEFGCTGAHKMGNMWMVCNKHSVN